MMIKLVEADRFLPIARTTADGAVVIHYGGDQAWFRTRVGRYSGCGATAAADVFAYLALRRPEYAGLYPYSRELNDGEFLRHMEDVISYVPPGKLPFIDMPYSGLTSLKRFTRYSDAFLQSRGVPLAGRWHSNRTADADAAARLVSEQLSRDNPVALLIMKNEKMTSIPYTDVFGKPSTTDITFHWVVITAIEEADGRRRITVSSEGARVEADFDDAWLGSSRSVFGWRGIVYFEPAK